MKHKALCGNCRFKVWQARAQQFIEKRQARDFQAGENNSATAEEKSDRAYALKRFEFSLIESECVFD